MGWRCLHTPQVTPCGAAGGGIKTPRLQLQSRKVCRRQTLTCLKPRECLLPSVAPVLLCALSTPMCPRVEQQTWHYVLEWHTCGLTIESLLHGAARTLREPTGATIECANMVVIFEQLPSSEIDAVYQLHQQSTKDPLNLINGNVLVRVGTRIIKL